MLFSICHTSHPKHFQQGHPEFVDLVSAVHQEDRAIPADQANGSLVSKEEVSNLVVAVHTEIKDILI
jgi:predicted transcriptional regulator